MLLEQRRIGRNASKHKLMTNSLGRRPGTISLPFFERSIAIDGFDDVIGAPVNGESQMVAQSFADVREVADRFHLDLFQLFLVSDTRVQEKVRGFERSG
jgi:hypothetical protein